MAETLTYKRGDTWRMTWQYRDDAEAPIDLTGCSARMQIRDKRSDAVLAEADSTDGLTIDDAAGDVAAVFLPAVTELIAPGTHETDLEMTYADGTVESTATLAFKVIEDITRDAS